MWFTLRKLRARPWTDRWLLLEALLCLGAFRVAILLLPFQRVIRMLHLTPGKAGSTVLDAALTAAVERIG